MKGRIRLGLVTLVGVTLVAIVMLTACGGTAASPEEEEEMGEMEEMEEGEEHDMEAMEEGEEHSMDHLMVPEDAAAMENPVEATDESIAAGEENFTTVCAPCHGEGGQGDGPVAETLDPPPQDLTQGDAIARTDGELFYIISNGIEETGMPAWEEQFTEEERWEMVTFIRSLQ